MPDLEMVSVAGISSHAATGLVIQRALVLIAWGRGCEGGTRGSGDTEPRSRYVCSSSTVTENELWKCGTKHGESRSPSLRCSTKENL
jgi:hypothetical protein